MCYYNIMYIYVYTYCEIYICVSYVSRNFKSFCKRLINIRIKIIGILVLQGGNRLINRPVGLSLEL